MHAFSVNNLSKLIGPASCRKANFGGDQLVLGAAINLEFGDRGRLNFDLRWEFMVGLVSRRAARYRRLRVGDTDGHTGRRLGSRSLENLRAGFEPACWARL